jgi:hypothetical protein
MRLFALAIAISLAVLTTAAAETGMPDSGNGRFSFHPVADGVLRLDTRTGQVSECSRSDAGWACKLVPDERSALDPEIARLQEENARLKKELLARGPPTPGAPGPDFKLPSDADVVAFLEKAWRRLIEMGRTVLKDSREEKLRDFFVR